MILDVIQEAAANGLAVIFELGSSEEKVFYFLAYFNVVARTSIFHCRHTSERNTCEVKFYFYLFYILEYILLTK